MHYSSGEVVQIGDKVLIDHRETEGVVEYVVETNDALIEWGLEPNDEFGLLIAATPYGLVFWQIEQLHDPVVFVQRAD